MLNGEHDLASRVLYKFLETRTKLDHYKQIVNLSPIPSFILDSQFLNLIFYNKAFQKWFNLNEFDNKKSLSWFKFMPESYKPEILSKLAESGGEENEIITHIIEHPYLVFEDKRPTDFVTFLTRMPNNGIVGYSIPGACKGCLIVKNNQVNKELFWLPG